MRHLWILLILLPLVGCSGTAYIPPEYLTGDVKDTLKNFNGAVADTSTLRDLAFWKARRNYDKMVASVPDKTEISFDMRTEGDKIYILPKITIQKAPTFQPIPDGPKDHAVWGVAKQWGSDLLHYGLIGFGLHEVIGGYKALSDNIGNEYHGPVQMTGSYNSAGRDNYVEANRPRMDQSTRTDSPGCSNGDCGEKQEKEDGDGFDVQGCIDSPPGGYNSHGDPLFDGTTGCSCTSHNLGHC
jgi:hypothetical protein